jgi:teichuronic acid biosynthesis glycosyltransferase TuaC
MNKLKVLVVCSGNSEQIFVNEQVNELTKLGLTINFFKIEGKGILGYLKNLYGYHKKINSFRPQIIHAHYGLSGLFANLQFKIPVVTTYHGTDINDPKNLKYSKISSKLSTKNIYISEELKKINADTKGNVVPCGVNTTLFCPKDKMKIREELNWDVTKTFILFSANFDNKIKNYPLAKEAIALLSCQNINLIELKGYSREEVSNLMNACDLALLTSMNEGSPQFIKEAMACNKPIVSTNVGDVKLMLENIDGTYICDFDPKNVAFQIKKAIDYSKINKETHGRDKIKTLNLDSIHVAKHVLQVYYSAIKSKKKHIII